LARAGGGAAGLIEVFLPEQALPNIAAACSLPSVAEARGNLPAASQSTYFAEECPGSIRQPGVRTGAGARQTAYTL